jgi:hypothetical protein
MIKLFFYHFRFWLCTIYEYVKNPNTLMMLFGIFDIHVWEKFTTTNVNIYLQSYR